MDMPCFSMKSRQFLVHEVNFGSAVVFRNPSVILVWWVDLWWIYKFLKVLFHLDYGLHFLVGCNGREWWVFLMSLTWVCLSIMLFNLFQLNYYIICYLAFLDLQVWVFVQKQHKHVLEFWVPVLILRILILSFVLLWRQSEIILALITAIAAQRTQCSLVSQVDWLLREWKVTEEHFKQMSYSL